MITIKEPQLLTRMDIWYPRYKDRKINGDWVVLLSCKTVKFATSLILVSFVRAKHLQGQRFAILKSDVMKYPVESNGSIDCYAVPMEAFDSWESTKELRELAISLFDH